MRCMKRVRNWRKEIKKFGSNLNNLKKTKRTQIRLWMIKLRIKMKVKSLRLVYPHWWKDRALDLGPLSSHQLLKTLVKIKVRSIRKMMRAKINKQSLICSKILARIKINKINNKATTRLAKINLKIRVHLISSIWINSRMIKVNKWAFLGRNSNKTQMEANNRQILLRIFFKDKIKTQARRNRMRIRVNKRLGKDLRNLNS